jgi:hypothetical protein
MRRKSGEVREFQICAGNYGQVGKPPKSPISKSNTETSRLNLDSLEDWFIFFLFLATFFSPLSDVTGDRHLL